MPKPVGSAQRYMPGLDGLRAIAVLAVIAYHLRLGWAPGGLLGVGVFFTLSGYLITDLLLGQRDALGRLRLGDFWLRRARRLLPALFLMLVVVVAWVTLLDPSRLPALRGDVAAAVLYVSNWWNIFREASYFARFGPPPPLDHLWSLAIEEQFYLVWPFLLWLGLRYARGRYRLAGLTLAAAALSSTVMALLTSRGSTPRGSTREPTPAPLACSRAQSWQWCGRAAAFARTSPFGLACSLTVPGWSGWSS